MNNLHKLSPDEINVYHLTTLGELIVLGVNIVEQCQSKDVNIDKGLFERALNFMQIRHPLMRASLHFEANQIFYRIHETLPLNTNEDISYKSFKTRKDLVVGLEEFNCKLFNYKIENSKLWRAFLYEFVDDNQSKKYAVGFLMPLFITGNLYSLTRFGINLIEN